MPGELKSMLFHLLIVVVVSYLLYRFHGRINRFVSKQFKSIKKGIDRRSHQRYANMVNREEAKLFGSEKANRMKQHQSSGSQHRIKRSSRSNTHG